MTGQPFLFNQINQCIVVTIETDIDDFMDMSGFLALVPELLARPAPVHRLSTLDGFCKRFAIDPGERQYVECGSFLRDDGNQPLFVPLNGIEPVCVFHKRTGIFRSDMNFLAC